MDRAEDEFAALVPDIDRRLGVDDRGEGVACVEGRAGLVRGGEDQLVEMFRYLLVPIRFAG